MITQSQLKELLDYDPETGVFRCKVSRGKRRAGAIAGSPDKDGYILLSIYKKPYKAHRLAFLYMVGKFPKNYTDHINGIVNDNRWENLREATSSQNSCNRRRMRGKESGLKGVTWHKKSKKWEARVVLNGKHNYIGLFVDKNIAVKAVKDLRDKLHGDFARQE